MTPEERVERFWDAVESAEDEWGVILGVFVDEDGEMEPSAMALEEVLDKREVN